jgi:hypothetical protein
VLVKATDASSNTSTCSFTVTVNDVEPPVIHDLAASPRLLWPPNHKMKNVTINYTTTDNCPGPITCHITVTSDESQNGPGNNSSNDWIVVDDHHVRLRAERAGHGDGRIYTTTVGCTDQHGNTATASATVTVPHSLASPVVRGIILPKGGQTNVVVMNEEDPDRSTVIQVFPNPSKNYFTINIQTENMTDKILVRVIDAAGRVVEVKNNLFGSQTLKIGSNLKAGLYFVEIRQGNDMKQLKLLKQE